MYVCVCVYVYVRTYAHTYVCTQARTHVYVCMYVDLVQYQACDQTLTGVPGILNL